MNPRVAVLFGVLAALPGCAGIGVGLPKFEDNADKATMDRRLTPQVLASPAVKDVEAKTGVPYRDIPICNDGPMLRGRDGADACRTTLVFLMPGEIPHIPPLSKAEIARNHAIAKEVRASGFNPYSPPRFILNQK